LTAAYRFVTTPNNITLDGCGAADLTEPAVITSGTRCDPAWRGSCPRSIKSLPTYRHHLFLSMGCLSLYMECDYPRTVDPSIQPS